MLFEAGHKKLTGLAFRAAGPVSNVEGEIIPKMDFCLIVCFYNKFIWKPYLPWLL